MDWLNRLGSALVDSLLFLFSIFASPQHVLSTISHTDAVSRHSFSLFIIQVIIDHLSTCFIPWVITAGGDELAFLAKGGEGVVDIELTAVTGPQGTEGRWSPRDVDIVLVVRWRMTMCLT